MNDKNLIGREEECRVLERCYKSNEPELVILYGRRRVGKTFLVTEFFEDCFAFRITGVYKKSKAVQLNNFTEELNRKTNDEYETFENWSKAFGALQNYLNSLPKDKKQVVFFDETPGWILKKAIFCQLSISFGTITGTAKTICYSSSPGQLPLGLLISFSRTREAFSIAIPPDFILNHSP